MSSFLDKNVLITGGAGGIGRLLGERALLEGASNLIIWDNNPTALARFAPLSEDSGIFVHTYLIDLTKPDQIITAADLVLNEIGPVDILFNNAGIVAGKRFVECTHEEIQQIMDLNVLGTLHTTRAFLPGMLARGSGHIVTIASASALMGNPRMSVYAGSKWAVSGWSESLRLELKSERKDLHVTIVQPGYIDTGMFEGVQPPRLTPLLKPEYIADKIIAAVQKNRPVLREPFMVKLVPLLRGVLPQRVFDLVADRLFRVYESMDTFRGRRRED